MEHISGPATAGPRKRPNVVVFLLPPLPPDAWLLRDALVMDGTGSAPYRADVRLRDGRISEIGALEPTQDERERDLKGATLTPGFIDADYPDPGGLLLRPEASAPVRQGVTTVVVGSDGTAPFPLARYVDALRARPTTVNVASYAGSREPKAPEALDVAFVSGPEAAFRGPGVWRAERWRDVAAVRAALDPFRKDVRPSLLAVSPFGTRRIAVTGERTPEAWRAWIAERGGANRITVDRFPSDPEREGKPLVNPPEKDLAALASRGPLRVLITVPAPEIDALLADDLAAPVGAGDGFPDHPGAKGAISRFLATRRDAAAIRRLTDLPARALGLKDRGVIRPGAWADLVLLGPTAESVWVAGRLTVDGNRVLPERAGRFLRP